MSPQHAEPCVNPTSPPAPPRVPEESDSNPGRWAVALVAVCALTVACLARWAGYLDRVDGLPAASASSPDNPTSNPDITVSGKVHQVFSPTEFTITDTDRGRQELLVVADRARTITVGTLVRVTGRMESPNRSAPENASKDGAWLRQPVLHATHIEVAGESPR